MYCFPVTWLLLTMNRETHRLDAATVATERKLRSGGGVLMARERCVMPVDCVRIYICIMWLHL